MSFGDIVVLILLGVAVAAAIISMKRQKSSGCGGCCSGCSRSVDCENGKNESGEKA